MISKDNNSISPTMVDRGLILSKCEYFVDVQLWPIQSILNPVRWLENFQESEMEYALSLLNSFLYFSNYLTDQMFIAAFQGISNKIRERGGLFRRIESSWRSFVDRVIITAVTGEIPNITDSGHIYARKARNLLRIEEQRIKDTKNTLQKLISLGPRPVIFVDDFVGSGNQFIETWSRIFDLGNSISLSFKALASIKGNEFYYIPLICTEYGFSRIRDKCPEVILSPTHVLSSRYNALDENSIIWPNHLRPTAVDFLRQVSDRAGIPDTNGGENDWRGFHKLGLTVSFEDSVPDATLPIFYWEENGWKPLIQKK